MQFYVLYCAKDGTMLRIKKNENILKCKKHVLLSDYVIQASQWLVLSWYFKK